MKSTVFSLFVGIILAGDARAQTHIDNLGKRVFEVGYQSQLLKDYTRNHGLSENLNYRPIQVNIWYPAGESGASIGQSMPTSTYLVIKSSLRKALAEFDDESQANILAHEKTRLLERGFDADQIDAALASKTSAVLNAKPLDREFPLVIFSPSMLIHSVSNVRFCEFLASQGYIVASHPSFGITRDMMTTLPDDLENQIRDSENVLNHILNSNWRISTIGVVGHSWGGMAAILTACRNPNILSVCSLDGSEEQWQELVLESPRFDVARFQVPFLRLALANNVGFGLFDSLANERIQVSFLDPKLTHFSFVSAKSNTAEIKEAHFKLVCNLTIEFLDATLKHETATSTIDSFDKLEKRYASENIVFNRVSSTQLISKEDAILAITTGRIEEVVELLDPNDASPYSEEFLLEIGECILWSGGYPVESERYFERFVQRFPDSYQGYEMLGHVQSWLKGDMEAALKFYTKALELSEGNRRIAQSIQELSDK